MGYYEKGNKNDKNLPHPRPPDYKHGWPWEKGAGSDNLLDAAEVGGHEEGGDGGEEAGQGEPEHLSPILPLLSLLHL